MTEAEVEEDEFLDDEDLGASIAFPPLYVLRAAARCPECREALYVYSLGCAAFRDADEGHTLEQFHFLRLVSSVPEQVTALLKKKCPSYFLDKEEYSEQRYLMNHCNCGAQLDDDVTHGDIGAAFVPATPEGLGHITLFRLPIDDEIPIECSYILGGGEYLNVAQAEAW